MPDQTSSDETDAVAATRTWLQDHWSQDLTLQAWWSDLAASGFGFPHWPIGQFGRGWSHDVASASLRCFADVGAIGPPTGLGTLMGAPVVLTYGTSEQQVRMLAPLADGTEGWCQLFSEPGAGSDLAAVATRAEPDGDEWIVTGQKVWTSGASDCRRGMLLARTDWDKPKNRGLSYFIIDLHQPGVEIRPLKQMNSRSHFSEVFFNEARVRDADRIGDRNNGWAIALATLAFERSGLSAGQHELLRPVAGSSALTLKMSVLLANANTNPRHDDEEAGSFAYLRAAANKYRKNDPTTRQQLIKLYSLERIARFSQQRSSARESSGQPPGPESSIAKLFWTNQLRVARDLSLSILGAAGMLVGSDTYEGGRIQEFFLSMPSASIAGGSDEIQRNIMAERSLGLPRDIAVDLDMPFREVRRS